MTGGITAALLTLPICLAANVQAENSITSALTGGKASANVRVRYETVDDAALVEEGEALTLRTRLGYETAQFYGFSVLGEFEDIHTLLGMDEYAPETVQVPAYATIQDRSVTEVNRAYLRYRGVAGLDLGYGRQRIVYDNQRFVGNVGWRQDEQTFDGFTAAYTGLNNFVFNYAYLTQVNGVDETLDSADIADNLFNVSYGGFSWGKISAYAYLLDHEDETDPTVNAGLRFKTSDTVGLRFDGGYVLDSAKVWKLLYTAELAAQEYENTAGTLDADADYSFVEGGVSYTMPRAVLTGKLAYESLGSDDGAYGFQTPYATKHAFNGWADKFLSTPAAGLVDTFFTAGVNLTPYAVNIQAVYHEYEADEGSADFGNEWNLLVSKTFSPNYSIGVKYASYSAEDLPYRDTDKLWVWGEFNF